MEQAIRSLRVAGYLVIVVTHQPDVATGVQRLDVVEAMHGKLRAAGLCNPTLMRKAGIEDYKTFAMQALEAVPDRPVSLEVFADEFDEMEQQALEIASWGRNVNVKIPVTNTRLQQKFQRDTWGKNEIQAHSCYWWRRLCRQPACSAAA